MKLAIVGSRNVDEHQWNEMEVIMCGLDSCVYTSIVSGGARGVDAFAKWWAEFKGKKYIEFLPDWETYGKGAGMIRNKQIVNECDKLVAFWDGKSKGTKNSIDLAEKGGKLLAVFYLENM